MSSRLVVLASGSGSNLQAVLDGCASGVIDASVVGVVTNRIDAYALVRADDAEIATELVSPLDGEERRDYDTRLAGAVASFEPDWVILAGWMRILTTAFIDHFPDRIVNLHPALPGELPGIRAIERAWSEALAGERSESGVMVHLVPDEGVDDGPVLASRSVPIDVSGTLEAFAASIHDVEHALLVETLAKLSATDHS
ncbi:phosphoribosylglycinamide formyltransferase [Ilumatobacter nonamiensis]|uniref:phosphoribosylglycinamide formyltransferase n=1 Tax=Ilumatobacter nonamiensis TaxID=467093 RepID=UPI00034B52D0|nr:phosphoribosylglycinamide formyltransferase [Ilumatobacter nonamiensis]